jgi:hypothetical protein
MGFFTITEVPDTFNAEHLLEAIGRNNFALIYDINSHRTLMWIEDGKNNLIDHMTSIVPGFGSEQANYHPNLENKEIKALSFYHLEEDNQDVFHDIFKANPSGGSVYLAFISIKEKEVETAKQYAEALLSAKDIRETKPTSPGVKGLFGPSSVHRDIYKDSEELLMAKSLLSSINEALLKNNLLYKMFLAYDSEALAIEAYLKDRITIVSEAKFVPDCFPTMFTKLSKIRSFPYGTKYCGLFLKFYGSRTMRTIKSSPITPNFSGMPIGKLMEEGIHETKIDISLEPSLLNLGFLITGLPGSGKTMEAMHIADRIISSTRCPVFILSPTEEWNGFAMAHGMNLTRLFSDSISINFFRCPATAQKDKFCQDLAIILSSASNAGPYKRPMEKCMLNAFRKIYQTTSVPDPVDVYYEIEESIIRLHGKRTNVGVKYTKHGENIKAALESLKIILNSPNYSTKQGINFEELLAGGAVFDMSGASIATKSLLYALILNQLYALTSSFDTMGDDKLRMFICIEEAQIIFKEEDAPAVEDLKQRIQDFRKRGIGLMLLTHNITDIDLGIRRLCQIRLYLKQAPDSAYLAAKELIFPNIESEKVIEKLKLLDSRVGTLSFVTRKGKEKQQEESLFIKTEAFEQSPNLAIPKAMEAKETINAKFELTFGDEFDPSIYNLEVKFLGELVHSLKLSDPLHKIPLHTGRKYLLYLINEKGKVIAETSIIGMPNVNLFVDKGKLIEIIH